MSVAMELREERRRKEKYNKKKKLTLGCTWGHMSMREGGGDAHLLTRGWRCLFNLEPMSSGSSPQAHCFVPPGIQMTATANGDPAETIYCPINVRSIPSLHLLQNNNRDTYLNTCVPLNKYALKGNWEAAERIVKRDQTLLTASITRGWDTILHIAAGARHVHFVERLVEMMDEQDLALQDKNGNTAFSIAAAAGSIEIAQIMMQKNKSLPTI